VKLQSARKSAIQAPSSPYIALMSMAFLLMAVIALRFPSTAAAATSASNIYFAQTAQGANNGADCADAYAYNDGNNGINKSVNWVPGNTLHYLRNDFGWTGSKRHHRSSEWIVRESNHHQI
jgi:hypothetical protein